MEDKILGSIWAFITDKFSGVRKPTSSAEVNELRSQPVAVQGIISLLDDDENLELYRSIGIPYLHIAVKGGTSPTTAQVQDAIAFQQSLDGLVAVHCTNGRRRTGTLLGAIYIQIMKSGKKSITQSVDASNGGLELFKNMEVHLLACKPDCDLREGQWEYLKGLAYE